MLAAILHQSFLRCATAGSLLLYRLVSKLTMYKLAQLSLTFIQTAMSATVAIIWGVAE